MVLIQDPLNTTPFSFYTDYLGSFISGRILRSCRVLLSTDMVLKKEKHWAYHPNNILWIGRVAHLSDLLKISHAELWCGVGRLSFASHFNKILISALSVFKRKDLTPETNSLLHSCTLNKTAGIRSILETRVSKITRRVASMRCAKRPVSDYSSINPFPVNSNDDLISKWLNIDPYWIYVFRLLAC